MSLLFLDVSFRYPSAVEPLWRDLDLHFTAGWTGIVGPNGCGKTTLLKLACGKLVPDRGQVRAAGEAVYCPQRTDSPPEALADFLEAMDRDAFRLRGGLAVEPDWLQRWPVLSHGERKRAQIAVALWLRPPVLGIDEPTNHIDARARALLVRALQDYGGVGLIVSHDRELLDGLCRSTVWIGENEAVVRPGGYSRAVAERKTEADTAEHRRKVAKQNLRRLTREADQRQRTAAAADRKRSARGLAPKDHDARNRIGRAVVSGQDGQAGRLTGQLEGRLQRARRELDEARVDKTHRLGIWLPGELSRRDFLFRMPAGEIPLGPDRVLRHGDVAMCPDERIGLVGPNGAGKSSLIRTILSVLQLDEERLLHVPQEISLDESRSILDRFRSLPPDERGLALTVVNRLGTRPARLLETDAPSPGELRKLLIALGLVRRPHLVVLDEPTNHLDLPAIECLESALDESPCGLLLVSHDRVFLRRLGCRSWRVEVGADGDSTLEGADGTGG